MKDEYLMRIGEAAKYMGVSTMTLRRWDKAGKLTSVRISKKKLGGNRKFHKGDLDILKKILNP